MKKAHWQKLTRLILLVMVLSLLAACALRVNQADEETAPVQNSIPKKITDPTYVPVQFNVKLEHSYSAETELAVDLLDEVTGLNHNIQRFPLQKSADSSYTGIVMLPLGGLVKYRYASVTPVQLNEINASGEDVIYRMLKVTQGTVVNDTVAGWPGMPYTGEFGDLSGIVTDRETNQPLADILVSVAGLLTFTDTSGHFQLDYVPRGIQKLTFASIDGSYQSYQQDANIVANLVTTAVVPMEAMPKVKLSFIVTAPNEAIAAPIRVAGNLYQMGNVYADLREGNSTLASRMPLMTRMDDGRYALEIEAFAGSYLVYKYTLGDGLLNAERDNEGSIILRSFIVPSKDATIEDEIFTWRVDDAEAFTIKVTVPDYTPAKDVIAIQFGQDEWLRPVPMWPLTDNQWMYVFFPDASRAMAWTYRICRAELCEIAYDEGSHAVPIALAAETSLESAYAVTAWHSWQPSSATTTMENPSFESPDGKLLGLELLGDYQPSFYNRYRSTLPELKAMGFTWIIFTPSWEANPANPLPTFSRDSGGTLWTQELAELVLLAKEAGFAVGLYPQLDFAGTSSDWWEDSTRTDLWWQTFYEEYERFVENYAIFAQQNQVDQLIIGGAGIAPSLPGALETTTTNSGTPKTAGKIWTNFLDKLRRQYRGTLLWSTPLLEPRLFDAELLANFDGLYLEIDAGQLNQDGFTAAFAREQRDYTVAALHESTGLPLFVGLNAASVRTDKLSCAAGACVISPAEPSCTSADVDLDLQAQFYASFVPELMQVDWIQGVSSRGFFPILKLQDCSSSVYGKPAMDFLEK